MRALALGALGLAAAGLVVLAVHPLREALGYAFHGDVHGVIAMLAASTLLVTRWPRAATARR